MPITINDVFGSEIASIFFESDFDNSDKRPRSQGHHLVPTGEANMSPLLKLLQWYGDRPDGELAGIYDHNDFDKNGIDLFSDPQEAHAR